MCAYSSSLLAEVSLGVLDECNVGGVAGWKGVDPSLLLCGPSIGREP